MRAIVFFAGLALKSFGEGGCRAMRECLRRGGAFAFEVQGGLSGGEGAEGDLSEGAGG